MLYYIYFYYILEWHSWGLLWVPQLNSLGVVNELFFCCLLVHPESSLSACSLGSFIWARVRMTGWQSECSLEISSQTWWFWQILGRHTLPMPRRRCVLPLKIVSGFLLAHPCGGFTTSATLTSLWQSELQMTHSGNTWHKNYYDMCVEDGGVHALAHVHT